MEGRHLINDLYKNKKQKNSPRRKDIKVIPATSTPPSSRLWKEGTKKHATPSPTLITSSQDAERTIIWEYDTPQRRTLRIGRRQVNAEKTSVDTIIQHLKSKSNEGVEETSPSSSNSPKDAAFLSLLQSGIGSLAHSSLPRTPSFEDANFDRLIGDLKSFSADGESLSLEVLPNSEEGVLEDSMDRLWGNEDESLLLQATQIVDHLESQHVSKVTAKQNETRNVAEATLSEDLWLDDVDESLLVQATQLAEAASMPCASKSSSSVKEELVKDKGQETLNQSFQSVDFWQDDGDFNEMLCNISEEELMAATQEYPGNWRNSASQETSDISSKGSSINSTNSKTSSYLEEIIDEPFVLKDSWLEKDPKLLETLEDLESQATQQYTEDLISQKRAEAMRKLKAKKKKLPYPS